RFTLQPAQSLGSTSDLFLAMHSGDSSTLILFKISGIPGVTSVTETPVSLPIRAWASPPQALQASSSVVLDTNDDRVLSVSWQQNSLWVAGNEACTPPGDTAARSRLRLVEIRAGPAGVRRAMSLCAAG